MAKLTDQIQVKVTDHGVDSGKRRLAIEVEATEGVFSLTEVLCREGIVKELRTELRSVIRNGVATYIQTSRELLKKLGASERPRKIREGKIKADLGE